MSKVLAVVGCGPKGAALAAKAIALRECGCAAPRIVIFEPHEPGAAWSGNHGYTDGNQLLCTLAERDLGYPYSRDAFASYPGVAERMFAQFSWHQFAVSKGIGETAYESWVLRGRRPPLHKDFAAYIADAVEKSKATGIVTEERQEVTSIGHNGSQWTIETAAGPYREPFDGVVITGSGTPRKLPDNANGRVFDGKSFWKRLDQIRDLLDAELEEDRAVAIIGAGGTGAAIAHWFVRNGFTDMPIRVIGFEPTLYSRWPSFFEDRLFTDEDAWDELSAHTKDAFVNRLNRGVVWDYVSQKLVDTKLMYRSFGALKFEVQTGSGAPLPLRLQLAEPPEDGRRYPPGFTPPIVNYEDATVFIDARGFDPWWFASKLQSSSGRPLREHFDPQYRDGIRTEMTRSLDVGGAFSTASTDAFPAGFHLPMIAENQGPAAPNLMALGWVADRILAAHV